ncbi:Fc.00g079040.m01.CDS01 [Cosmosporella sp. VM-42]
MVALYKTLVISALSLIPTAIAADSNSTASKVGWSGKLSSLDGGLGGTVKVVDSKSLQIDNYKLEEASAPALYWWGATDGDVGSGFRISNERVSKSAESDSLTIALDAGKTPEDFTIVGLWCERFSANFGQATLSEDGDAASNSDMPSSDKKTNGAQGARTVSKAMAGTFAAIPMLMAAFVL